MSEPRHRMPKSRSRAMFWRIVRRLAFAHRARLFVILLALGAGAAVTAALLNLQVDAKRRLTSEFRAFGPNVLLLPKNSSPEISPTLPESVVDSIPRQVANSAVVVVPRLYAVVRISSTQAKAPIAAVLAGSNGFGNLRVSIAPQVNRSEHHFSSEDVCILGVRLAEKLGAPKEATLQSGDRSKTCQVGAARETGGPDDDRIAMTLSAAQKLAGLPGRISVVELTAPGPPKQIAEYAANLQRIFPEAKVRPLRQFTEAQEKIYSRIAALLDFTVALVLILTSLCVMAAMANVAAERRNDVGLMKAIGGAKRRVLRLFLAEATLLGVAGGVIGAAAGIALSMYLGKAVFGLPARPRLIVYPVSVALTVIVAILSAFPLRRLAGVRPASVFRGEA